MNARTWPRLDDPPTDVRYVRSASGTLWTRMEPGGHYWSAPGWEAGVSWAQVLSWGPVTEVSATHATPPLTCRRCGRPADARGKTCCALCWIGYGTHSRLCRRRYVNALSGVPPKEAL